jgi:hypothetical protein
MRELPMDPISYEKVTVVSVLQQGLGRLEYVGCGGFGMGLDIGQDQAVNTIVWLHRTLTALYYYENELNMNFLH